MRSLQRWRRRYPSFPNHCCLPALPAAQAATDDLQRILAELAVLEEAASMGRSTAGGGAATASDYCEGAEVSEIE